MESFTELFPFFPVRPFRIIPCCQQVLSAGIITQKEQVTTNFIFTFDLRFYPVILRNYPLETSVGNQSATIFKRDNCLHENDSASSSLRRRLPAGVRRTQRPLSDRREKALGTACRNHAGAKRKNRRKRREEKASLETQFLRCL